jgi:hypothetical protein
MIPTIHTMVKSRLSGPRVTVPTKGVVEGARDAELGQELDARARATDVVEETEGTDGDAAGQERHGHARAGVEDAAHAARLEQEGE